MPTCIRSASRRNGNHVVSRDRYFRNRRCRNRTKRGSGSAPKLACSAILSRCTPIDGLVSCRQRLGTYSWRNFRGSAPTATALPRGDRSSPIRPISWMSKKMLLNAAAVASLTPCQGVGTLARKQCRKIWAHLPQYGFWIRPSDTTHGPSYHHLLYTRYGADHFSLCIVANCISASHSVSAKRLRSTDH